MTVRGRGQRGSWTVTVYQTSNADGPQETVPDESGQVEINLQVGESLLVDFGRSLDVCYEDDAGMIGYLPDWAQVELGVGCLTWKPRAARKGPACIKAVAGARSLTLLISVHPRRTVPSEASTT